MEYSNSYLISFSSDPINRTTTSLLKQFQRSSSIGATHEIHFQRLRSSSSLTSTHGFSMCLILHNLAIYAGKLDPHMTERELEKEFHSCFQSYLKQPLQHSPLKHAVGGDDGPLDIATRLCKWSSLSCRNAGSLLYPCSLEYGYQQLSWCKCAIGISN